jgi:hypothetical protein
VERKKLDRVNHGNGIFVFAKAEEQAHITKLVKAADAISSCHNLEHS